jgi:hypothetical protein
VSLLCALVIMTPPVWSQFPLVDFLIPEMLRGRLHSVLLIVGVPGVAGLPMLAAIAIMAILPGRKRSAGPVSAQYPATRPA